MEPLRRVIETIRKNLGGMKPEQWLLVGALGVIVVMVLLMVALYSGKPVLVPALPGATAEEQQRAIPILEANRIKYENRGGQIFIPQARQMEAIALLSQSGQQPSNTAVVFQNILKNQNWINSKEQNRQIYKVMLDNFLSEVVGRFDGVQSAKVFVDAPEAVGIGQAARPPKASITIFAKPGKPLSQATVDAAARIVAGSVAGLELSRVSVADGAGMPRKVTDDSELAGNGYRETAAAMERQFREKIYNLVRHIDGVVVEVTATVDVTRSRSTLQKNLPMGQGTVAVPKKETSNTTMQAEIGEGAEPGVRSNTQANIAVGSSQGSKNETKQDDTEFAVGIGTESKHVDDPGGMPTRLVATVNVPRNAIISMLLAELPAPAEGAEKPAVPEPEKIAARFTEEEGRIRKALEPHVKTRAPNGQIVEGEVVVTMVSGEGSLRGGGMAASLAGGGGAGGLGLGLLGSGLIEKGVLGLLALMSVAMMFLMVRKAGKRLADQVPTVEELVGAPPKLRADEGLVGEADESETAITGIELGEEEIRADKIREQVGDLVKASPEVAAKVLNRWISVEE
ncbi:MAG: hypothetical protein KF678_09380 [Phycisphaeraceae bacterium]|nr:hypothetical protein [Phycisphaeraceae bacterium]